MPYDYIRVQNYCFELGKTYKGLNNKNYTLIAKLEDKTLLFLYVGEYITEYIYAYDTKMYLKSDNIKKIESKGIQWVSAKYYTKMKDKKFEIIVK